MQKRRTLAAVGLAMLAPLVAAGCGGGTDAPAIAAPVARPSVTAAPPRAATPSPAATARSSASLQKALLTLDDVPSGLSLSKDEGDENGLGVRSAKAGCAALVRLMNADRTPGSVGYADAGFDGGSSGPFFGETLESFAPGGARSAVTQVADAVRSCDEVRMDVDGSGEMPFTVDTTSSPDLGDAATAVRFTATDDETGDGFQFDVAFVAAGDVLLSTTSIEADPSDLEGFTSDAFDKLVHGRVGSGNGSSGSSGSA